AIKRLLLADDYDGILDVARGQVETGAHLLDVCVALTERQDEADQMSAVVKLLAQGVETPLMIDSTEYDVVEAALKRYPGRAAVNSINLENGRERIERVVPHVVEHGAVVVALTIDEQGMAKTADRKLEIARRIRDIVCDEYGLEPDALIFDDLTFTLATGDEEFRRSAIETIEGIRLIKRELPGVLTSLGVSNVSFGLAKHARAVLNSVFMHHCVEAGLDMAIVNPAHITPYAEIDAEQRKLADDLIFDRGEDALAKFIAFYESHTVQEDEAGDPTEGMTPDAAVHWKILHRKKEGIEDVVEAAIASRTNSGSGSGSDSTNSGAGSGSLSGAGTGTSTAGTSAAGDYLRSLPVAVRDRAAVDVLNNVLLPAMKEVGDKFGAGELILPFVLQSAEVMKRAVARLEQYLEKKEGQTKGKVVIATVFGDVHDIGKSLVYTIMTNNGYTVYDLGKQVPVNTIIEKAQEVGADAIGLSALLVSTSKQMPLCVQELHARGLDYPVLVGGAAINPSFVRMASYADQENGVLYPSGVFYCKDAFEGLSTIDTLMDPAKRETFVKARLEDVVTGIAKREELKARTKAAATSNGRKAPSRDIVMPKVPFHGVKHIQRLPLAELFEFFDLNTLYRLHWGAKNAKGPEYERLVREEYEPRLRRMKTEAQTGGWLTPSAVYGYFPVASDGNTIVVYDPDDPQTEIGRFETPRQPDRDELALADYFISGENGARDVAALQIVTVGDALLERSERMMREGDYTEGYYLHGFGVRLAEAAAEWVNRHIVAELGLEKGRGLRYSWGYPAIPDHTQHHLVFDLLPAREKLGMDVTDAGALVPELSTAAIVVHHPEAKYFSV
ncbi:MAG TPA: dihydropteroate synthase, partial [Longimicrobiales bacterium]|nr:dihydropteroate synthase [Longimicrobiales bacterium]